MNPETYGFLSTYPPTQCGIATFTASLAAGVRDDAEVGIVRLVERAELDLRPEVVHQMVNGAVGSEAAAAAALDCFDVAVIQHEFGIYGGPDGDAVIGVLRRLHVPSIVVLHTVGASPTANQRAVLAEVVRHAAVVVVMTKMARRRLLDSYPVRPERVVVIPHGAPSDWAVAGSEAAERTPKILTWGLLGPGKGIEWAIDAMSMLGDLDSIPHYVVAGGTHPRVLEHQGDVYREGLKAQATQLGVSHLVDFDNRYLDQPSLRKLVTSADVVVLPYDSKDQVTSGVLIEAVACRRPVVATAFPHAVELLSSGAGIVVPQRDAGAIAAAVRRILTEPGLSESMVTAAERLAPDLTWRAVAERYRMLGRRLSTGDVSVVA
jgi:glycosyltransferase involved in cell wall biosynthesis